MIITDKEDNAFSSMIPIDSIVNTPLGKGVIIGYDYPHGAYLRWEHGIRYFINIKDTMSETLEHLQAFYGVSVSGWMKLLK